MGTWKHFTRKVYGKKAEQRKYVAHAKSIRYYIVQLLRDRWNLRTRTILYIGGNCTNTLSTTHYSDGLYRRVIRLDKQYVDSVRVPFYSFPKVTTKTKLPLRIFNYAPISKACWQICAKNTIRVNAKYRYRWKCCTCFT